MISIADEPLTWTRPVCRPSAALAAYLQILRDLPTLEDAVAWAEAHPLRSPEPSVADPVPWLEQHRNQYQGPAPLRLPNGAPLHLREPVSVLSRIARREARPSLLRRLITAVRPW